MDSLTQIVLGAAIGELVLGKKIANKAAIWGAIGGTIPDLDVIGKYFMSDIDGLLFHRGFMHSILFVFLIGPFISYFPYKIYMNRYSNVSYFDWWTLFFLALITHPILDAFTTWGTQLFWPLNYRIALKSIFVVDPIYTMPFLIFLIIALFLPQNSTKRRWFNMLGLIISSSILLLTTLRQEKAKQDVLFFLKKQDIEFEDVSLRALPLNVFWNVSVKTNQGFLNTIYSTIDKQDSLLFTYLPNHKDLLDNDVLALEDYAKVRRITDDYFIVNKIDNGFLISDLRFGKTSLNQTKESKFMFQYKIQKNEIGEYTTIFIQNKPNPRELFDEFNLLFK